MFKLVQIKKETEGKPQSSMIN